MSTINKVKELGNKVMVRLPKEIMIYLRDFQSVLPILNPTYPSKHPDLNINNIHSQLSRLQFQQVAYTSRQFQKLGGFIFIAALPFVGSIIGCIGLLYPRNILTHHFWTEEEEHDYLRYEWDAILKASTSLKSTLFASKSLPLIEINDLSRKTLIKLCTASGINFFGTIHPISFFPRGFLQRWLEIKARDISLDDHFIREMLIEKDNDHDDNFGDDDHCNIEQQLEILLSNNNSDNNDDNCAQSETKPQTQNWVLPKNDMSDREVLRAAILRGIDPNLPINEVRYRLITWVTSMESLMSFPPSPLTPNVMERVAGKIADVLGYQLKEGEKTKVKKTERKNEKMTFTETMRLFTKFAWSPITRGPRIVQLYSQHHTGVQTRRNRETTTSNKKCTHVKLLFDLVRNTINGQ